MSFSNISHALALAGTLWCSAGGAQVVDTHAYARVDDLVWASPRGHDLVLDVYTPEVDGGPLPVIVMYHGGGWLVNDESIMDEAAAFLASRGEYVVVNVDYRLLGDLDNSVTMDEIVADAFGSLLWVREHVGEYGGDAERIAVTGDSAGGHLATLVATEADRLSTEDDAFQPPLYAIRPSYLPEAGLPTSTAGLVDAAIISYGAFDLPGAVLGGFERSSNIFWQLGGAEPRGIFGPDYNLTEHADRYRAVSPLYLVDSAATSDYPPMLFTVGSEDGLTTPASIETYVAALRAAGHDDIDYWVHEGRPHAFLDSGRNEWLGIEFGRDAVPALEYMLGWLGEVF